MRIIEILTERIEEELDDAESYIEMSLQYREEFPMVAKTFCELSMQEMDHVEMLHNDVKDIIEKHKREHGEPPAAMMAVYEFVHKKEIKKAAKIKLLQNQYKGM